MAATEERPTAPLLTRRPFKVLLIAVLGVLVTAAVVVIVLRARANHRAEALERSVRGALGFRDLAEARRLIDRWTTTAPAEAAPHYYRAWLEVAAERPQEAMDALRAATQHGYPARPVLTLRAVLQARAGQFADAEPVLREAFRAGSEPRAEVAEGLTRIELANYRLAEASQTLARWMEAAPSDARPYVWRNELDQRRDAPPERLMKNDREALRRDPGLQTTRLHLANLLLEARSAADAGAEFAEVLARDPTSLAAHDGAGQVALLQGDVATAARHFNEVLSRNPADIIALRELALIDLRRGAYSAARDRLAKLAALEPFDVEVRSSYARALKLSGDDAQAAAEAVNVEHLRQEQRRFSELKQSLARHPGDPSLRSDVSRWLIEHGHEAEGLEWADLILKEHPGHAATCRLLTDYHTRKGNIGLANYYRSVAQGERNAPSR